MQQYDVTLKALLRERPPRILEQIGGGAIDHWGPAQLPRVQNLRTDLLGVTPAGELVHLELQSRNDAEMPFRMLEYSVAITRTHKQVPRQILLFVGSDRLSMPAVYEWKFGATHYTLVDIRDLDREALLASTELGDNVLGILAGLKDRRLAVPKIIDKLLQSDRMLTSSYAEALLNLAGLRPGLASEVEEMLTIEIDPSIIDHEVLGPVYRRGMLKGVEEGKLQGMEEGQRSVLRRLIQRRLGPMPAWFESRLDSLSRAELDVVSSNVLDATSFEGLLAKP